MSHAVPSPQQSPQSQMTVMRHGCSLRTPNRYHESGIPSSCLSCWMAATLKLEEGRPSPSIPLHIHPTHIVKLAAHDMHLGRDGPEVVIRLLVANVAGTDHLPDLAGYLWVSAASSRYGTVTE